MRNNKIEKDEAHVASDEREMMAYAGPNKFLNLEEPFPGDSVDGHKRKEEANMMFAEDEIGQQNENL